MRTLCANVSILSLVLLQAPSVLAVPGTGIGLTGKERVLDVSPLHVRDVLRGSFDGYQLVTSDGMIAIKDKNKRSIRSETTVFSPSEAVDAAYYAREYFRVLKTRFGRDGFDGKSSPVSLLVGMTYTSGSPDACTGLMSSENAANASWDPGIAYFSGKTQWTEAWSSSPTILAHELTHGVTATTSQLGTSGEPGALNESFSDIMGAYFRSQIEPKEFDWSVGKETQLRLECGNVRYLNTPDRGFYWAMDPSSESPQATQEPIRDHYSNLYKGEADKGGVHINSGIPSLAFYLLSQGGSHPRSARFPGPTVKGIGIEKAIQIFYRGFTKYLRPESTMKDAKDATIKAAQEINPATLPSVRAAWAAVGV